MLYWFQFKYHLSKLYHKLHYICVHKFIPLYCCKVCRLYSLKLVCKDCYDALIKLPPIPNNTTQVSSNINNIYCHYAYNFPLSKMVHAFKYKRHKQLSLSLGYLLYPVLLQVKGNPDMFIPMPLHNSRHKERGFNQALLLLNYYCVVNGKIPVYTHIVKRVIDTTKQALVANANERILNIANAFELNVPANIVFNKHIVIIDDVITTGATANELARLLKASGARQVDVCALLKVI